MIRKNYDKGIYFASVEDPTELAAGMQEKIREWRGWCANRGLIDLWKRKLSNYYGISAGGNTSQRISRGGSEGELSMMKVNDLHNLIQNQLVLVTGQRPAGVAKAINSDTKSQKAAKIGTAVAEYYMSSHGFEGKFVNAALISLLCDESFVELGWDKSAGDPIMMNAETGQPEMSGDATMNVHSPWNVSRDPGMPVEIAQWHIITFPLNRFDAAANYPRFKDEILMVGDDNLGMDGELDYIPESSDAIKGHLLVHDRTAAVPSGRYSLMIGDTVVFDTELPFPDYPVQRMSSEDVINSCTGYSAANDVMALEEATDALVSVVLTNQVTFGGQCLVAPEGINLNHTELAKGVRLFKLPPDQVNSLKSLDLLHTPPEIFNFIGLLGNKKEQQLGINSVVRGQPEGQLSGASGSALALIQAQAISFNSGTQRSYFTLMSDSMTSLISILRVYADTPRIARIVGKAKASGLKEFRWTGNDLQAVSSIVYEMTNAVSQTLGGRLTMAQDLLKTPGMIKSPKQYINVVSTGNLDVLTEDDEADALNILEENEWLTEGKPVKAVITQIHADHIKSHTSQISLEMAVGDPATLNRILAHIQDHITLWQQASESNPGILMATGQPPLLPAGGPSTGGPQAGGPVHPLAAPPPQLAPPGAHPGPAGPQINPGNGKGHMQALVGGGNAPVLQKASQIHQPNLPMVAGTQNRAVVPGVTTA